MKANRSEQNRSERKASPLATIVVWVLVALAICGTVFLRLQAESAQVSYTEVEVRVVSVRKERPWWAFFDRKIAPSTIVTVEYNGTERRLKNSSWAAEGSTVTAYESGGELYANPSSIWTDTPMGHAYFAGMGISFVLFIVALTCTTYYRRDTHSKLTTTSLGKGTDARREVAAEPSRASEGEVIAASPQASREEVAAGSSQASKPAAFVDLYDGINSQTGEKVEPFTMDSYEWHYDSALSAYCERHHKDPDSITDVDDEKIWESSALHISYFVNWLISHDFIEPYDEESRKLQDSVRRREDTPYAYLNLMLDDKLHCSDIRWAHGFVDVYYDAVYLPAIQDRLEKRDELYTALFSWEECDEVCANIERDYRAFFRERFVNMTRLISGNDEQVISDLELYFDAPEEFIAKYEDELYERGVIEDDSDKADLYKIDGGLIIMLIDMLRDANYICELDWKVGLDELVPSLAHLHHVARLGVIWDEVERKLGRTMPDGNIETWAQSIAQYELARHGLSLGYFDIDSDEYVFFVAPREQAKQLSRLAHEVNVKARFAQVDDMSS